MRYKDLNLSNRYSYYKILRAWTFLTKIYLLIALKSSTKSKEDQLPSVISNYYSWYPQ